MILLKRYEIEFNYHKTEQMNNGIFLNFTPVKNHQRNRKFYYFRIFK